MKKLQLKKFFLELLFFVSILCIIAEACFLIMSIDGKITHPLQAVALLLGILLSLTTMTYGALRAEAISKKIKILTTNLTPMK